MVFASLPRAVLAICLSIIAMRQVSAQTVLPTNDTTGDNSTAPFILETTISMMDSHANVAPLTDKAGLTGSTTQLKSIIPQGPLVLTDTRNVASLEVGNIAFLSCEPSDYASGSLDASRTIQLAANNQPDAIVLYSVYSAQCSFNTTDGFLYYSMYTMLNANQSAALVAGLNKNNPPSPETTISYNQNAANGSGNGSGGNNNGAGGNVLGKSPTTAVAMIILYSITGIITFLFLAIIVVGAIRAHRHPERYGPRRITGRQRQSRAKGIARAMLETLPIVKFGDKEDDKPPETGGSGTARDVELAETQHGTTTAETAEPRSHATGSNTDGVIRDGPDIVTTEAAPDTAQTKEKAAAAGNGTDNGLACSVCTDDFVKGQDIRVLPCKHKFHPECIDPWLLNVSGTCPLCRVDLHPTASHDPDTDGEDAMDESSLGDAPAVADAPHGESARRRNRRSRILHTLNIGHMRHATPEERIAALRRLRSEDQAIDSTAEQGGRTGTHTPMNRFSRRISRAFGGSRPASGVNSRPVSEIPPAAADPIVPTTAEQTTATIVETTSPEIHTR